MKLSKDAELDPRVDRNTREALRALLAKRVELANTCCRDNDDGKFCTCSGDGGGR